MWSSGRCSTTGRPRMLLELTRWLQQLDDLFGLFGYLTFRGILSALTALAPSLWWGPAVNRRLRSEELREGKEGVSTCKSRWEQDHETNKYLHEYNTVYYC